MRPPDFELLCSPDELAAALGELLAVRDSARSPAHAPAEAIRLRSEGYGVLPGTMGSATAESFATAVTKLCRAGWPGVFLFVLEDPWTVARGLERAISEVVSQPYELLADAWAWSIEPGRTGWQPHRGGGTVALDRNAPELLTAWTALSDVTAERACMHLVPLDLDPNFPEQLERYEAPLAAVRAIPVTAGTTIVWNANVLHWGGSCSLHAVSPRVSSSLSFGRIGARAAHGVPPLPDLRDLNDRVGFVATQIVTYASKEVIAPPVLEWARAIHQLNLGASHFRGISPP